MKLIGLVAGAALSEAVNVQWKEKTKDWTAEELLAHQKKRFGQKDGDPGEFKQPDFEEAAKRLKSNNVKPPTKAAMMQYLQGALQTHVIKEVVGDVIENEPSRYAYSCGGTWRFANDLGEKQKERNKYAQKYGYDATDPDAEAPEHDPKDQSFYRRKRDLAADIGNATNPTKVFGGDKTRIEDAPWQAYFHIADKLTDPDEITAWEEANAVPQSEIDFALELQEQVDHEDSDPELVELVKNMLEGLLAERTPRANYVCGATLISSAYVLTAAHCTEKATDIENSGVIVGITEIDTKEGVLNISPHNWRPIGKIIQHSEWNTDTLENDIALVRMKYTIDFNKQRAPICLPTGNQCLKEGHRLRVSGWGTTEDFGDDWEKYNTLSVDEDGYMIEKEHLRAVEVPIMKLNDCIWQYSSSTYDSYTGTMKRKTYITNKHICAGGEDGKDACNGDSGGPLSYVDKDGFHTLVGVVSWGDHCGKENFPTVYTRVSGYLDWIADNSNVKVQVQDPENYTKWYDQSFKFGKCYDTQYRGSTEFLTGLKEGDDTAPSYQPYVRPDRQQVQNGNNHITADFVDFPTNIDEYYEQMGDWAGAAYGLRDYFCATKGNIHIKTSVGLGVKLGDCRNTDLGSEWVMNRDDKTIETAVAEAMSNKKFCWVAKDANFKAFSSADRDKEYYITIGECPSRDGKKLDEEDQLEKDMVEGITYDDFRYDVYTNQIWVNVRGKEWDADRLAVGYNMWRQDKLVLQRPNHYQWGITHFTDDQGRRTESELIDNDGNLFLLPQSTYHLGQPRQGAGKTKKTGAQFWRPFRFCAQVYDRKITTKGKKGKKKTLDIKAVRVLNCMDIPEAEKNVWEHHQDGSLFTVIDTEIPNKRDPAKVKEFSKFGCRGKKKACLQKKKQWFKDKKAFYNQDVGSTIKSVRWCLGFKFDWRNGNVVPGPMNVRPCLSRPDANAPPLRKYEWNASRIKFDKRRNVLRWNRKEKQAMQSDNQFCMHPNLKFDEECSKDNKEFRYYFTDVVGSKCVYGFSWNANNNHHKLDGAENEYREFGLDYMSGYNYRPAKLSKECKEKAENRRDRI